MRHGALIVYWLHHPAHYLPEIVQRCPQYLPCDYVLTIIISYFPTLSDLILTQPDFLTRTAAQEEDNAKQPDKDETAPHVRAARPARQKNWAIPRNR